MAVDAVALGRGGRAILEAWVGVLLARGASVTVFGTALSPQDGLRCEAVGGGRLALLRWAVRGWAEASAGFDRKMSFTGFAAAPGQVCFVHNALYYEEAARVLPLAMQARLAVLRELTGAAVAESASVVVQSAAMVAHVWRAHGRRAEKIVTVPAGVLGEGVFGDAGKQADLLWVGNELPFKDAAAALEAVSRMEGRRLTLVGNTVPMASGLRHRWVGELERADVFGLYRGASALVMTSRAESLGLPLAEAMQCGLVVVAPDLPYARELCGDAAVYFEAGDVGGLVSALAQAESRRQEYVLKGLGRAAELELARPFEVLSDLVLD